MLSNVIRLKFVPIYWHSHCSCRKTIASVLDKVKNRAAPVSALLFLIQGAGSEELAPFFCALRGVCSIIYTSHVTYQS